MNVWGKVFLGLTIVLAATDTYLVTVLYRNKSHYLQQIENRRNQLAQAETKFTDLSKRVQDKQNELSRIETAWGQFFNAPQGRTLNAQQGTLAIEAGAQQGLLEPAADKSFPVLHVFANQANGGSKYLGEFALSDLQAAQSGLQLTQQPPLPTSVAALGQLQGESLRVRESMPAAYRGLIDDYFARYSVLAQQLNFQQSQLQNQTEQLAKSQAILAQRLAELNGDPQPPEGASEEVVQGLVVTIRDAETARNGNLQVLDGLRHDYARKIVELNDLVEKNQQAVGELPGYEQSRAKPEPRTAAK
ncbi:MAG: hypothetical protein U0992_03385 [Planctomycetaceae bacterium]